MKKITFLSFVFMLSAYLASAQYEISGVITYDNSGSTPMTNCTVYLLSGSDTMAQTVSTSTGAYTFSNLGPGTYSVIVSTTKPYASGSSSDALMVLRHFVGMPPALSGIRLRAADVNGNGIINSVDAMSIIRRFTNHIPYFRPPYVIAPGAPDWLFDTIQITLTNSSATANIKAICMGDTNGSYIPSL